MGKCIEGSQETPSRKRSEAHRDVTQDKAARSCQDDLKPTDP
jgi:hypothetical protein